MNRSKFIKDNNLHLESEVIKTIMEVGDPATRAKLLLELNRALLAERKEPQQTKDPTAELLNGFDVEELERMAKQ